MSKSFVGPSGAAQQIPGAETLDELQPDILRASQDDYNPPELLLASMLRLRATTALNLSGLAGTLRARVLKLQCSPQGSAITLLNESALSIAANRFTLGGDLTLSPGTLVELFYDPSSARWRVVSASPAASSGAFIGFRVLTVSGNYTPTPGTRAAFVTAIGPGGGGAGAPATVSRGQGGGGGGAWCSKYILNPVVTAFVIGAGGAGGAIGASGAAGSASTTFGAILTAPAGAGATFVSAGATSFPPGGFGAAVATGGDINSGGNQGQNAAQGNNSPRTAGAGASTPYGAGGSAGNSQDSGAVDTPGGNGTGFGSGGGGGFPGNGAVGAAGGNGASGAILVWEYA